jgi:protein-L-isoaspartate(D-aspartate) O-methyltransferase
MYGVAMALSLYGPRLPVVDHEALRHAMVEHHLHAVRDGRVLAAMQRVPRHLFVPEELHERAYEDVALPVGYGKTLARPRLVAELLQAAALLGTERVLEIGVTSGYETALLALLAKEVFALGLIPGLAEVAKHNLHHADCPEVHLVHGDAALGWPEAAPYDVILLSDATVSPSPALFDQLSEHGRLLLPVGPEPVRTFRRMTRAGSEGPGAVLDFAPVPLAGVRRAEERG